MIFREWLNELYRKVFISKSNISIENYISHFVCEVPVPPATKQLKVKFHIGDKILSISRPSQNGFPLSDVRKNNHITSLTPSDTYALFI